MIAFLDHGTSLEPEMLLELCALFTRVGKDGSTCRCCFQQPYQQGFTWSGTEPQRMSHIQVKISCG